MGFHAFKLAKSLWRCLKPRATDPMVIEGDLRSESHMDEDEAYCPNFLVRKQVTVPDLG